MRREIRDYVEDIRQAIGEIETFTRGVTKETFLQDRKTVNAVIRSLEIIGEAAKNLPETIRKKYPAIPWRDMAGMRDKLIHAYHGVDLEILWVVVTEELPPLKPHIEKIREDIEVESS